jgi:hypothetical protein
LSIFCIHLLHTPHMAAGNPPSVSFPAEFITFTFTGNAESEVKKIVDHFLAEKKSTVMRQLMVHKGAMVNPTTKGDVRTAVKGYIGDIDGMAAGIRTDVLADLRQGTNDTGLLQGWITGAGNVDNVTPNNAHSLPQRLSLVNALVNANYQKRMTLLMAKHPLLMLYDPYMTTLVQGKATSNMNLN